LPKSRILWSAFAVALIMAAAGLVIGCSIQFPGVPARQGHAQIEGLPPEFQRLAEVWEVLQKEHYGREQLDAEKVSDGAIRGMMLALDDRYASFLDAKQYSVESQDLRGFFEGIGAQVVMEEGLVTILAPLPNTPAAKAGLEPGDAILAINGESTAGLTLLEAVNRIRGPKGTTVTLSVLHRGSLEPATVTITRAVIELSSVELKMLDGGIGRLKISEFNSNTNDELKDALAQFRQAQGRALVIDLRNNPGGLLNSVVDVASQFLKDGLVLYEMDAVGNRTDWKVRGGGQAQDVPLVVLINEYSASAAEVLSGALLDRQRATLVGATSYGKGSVNTLRQLNDGSAIYFTIARWFTPNGNLIEGKGITPNVPVESSRRDQPDAQMAKALEILNQQLAAGNP